MQRHRVIFRVLLRLFSLVAGMVALTLEAAPHTISEKLAAMEAHYATSEESGAQGMGRQLAELRHELREHYHLLECYIAEGRDEHDFFDLLQEINLQREEIRDIEKAFADKQSLEICKEGEPHGVWDQEELTISQLVMEYGSQDALYVVPADVAAVKIHLRSMLAIPRAGWPALVDVILKSNGIGVKELNPYTKQLYLLKQELTAAITVASKPYELEGLEAKSRIIYLFAPPEENLRSAFYFLERFRDPKTTFLYQVGAKIVIAGFQEDVKRLVGLSDKIWAEEQQKITKVVTLTRLAVDEGIAILRTYFGGLAGGGSGSVMMPKGGHDLSALPLPQGGALVLVGSKHVVQRAEDLLRQTEGEVEDPSELVVYWYNCRHCNPEEIVEVLEKVYLSLINSQLEGGDGRTFRDREGGDRMPDFQTAPDLSGDPVPSPVPPGYNDPARPYGMVGQRQRQADRDEKQVVQQQKENFIPYPATGAVCIVVRKDVLGKIKELLKKLDTPKKMVEIEVLLCERRINNSTRSGINVLRIGADASNTNKGGFNYDAASDTLVKGLMQFFISNPRVNGFPAFDVSYNFLLSQEDIHVTASPSVVTLNQIPATIAITDQISINNGASPVNSNTGVIFKDSFERADFGITITLTPTVHEPDPSDPTGDLFITLENDISFETITNDRRDRPDVHKRRVKNQVRIADGQTIILGGLRAKSVDDKSEKIPFLGELPGIGKLFGTDALNDTSTEMFIFIKPRVIRDPVVDLIRIRDEKLRARPGDIECLIQKIKESQERCQTRLFKKSFELFFGNPSDAQANF